MDAASRQLGQCSTSGRSWNTASAVHSGTNALRTRCRCDVRVKAAFALQVTTPHQLPRKQRRCQIAFAGLNGTHSASLAGITEADALLLQKAAVLADGSAGLTAPHPNAGCVLADSYGKVVAATHQRAQGSESAETQAVRLAGTAAAGSTAYLNLETADCEGDDASLRALVAGGVSRAVIGLRNPLRHSRGRAVKELRQAGVVVEVLREAPFLGDVAVEELTYQACLDVNEAVLHRAATGKPFGILKYAMTLDGKIATSSGHSAWVTAPPSRARVFETRARSDAVIVGGQTVRRDNPRLTTRREAGHTPVRIVMSRTLDLPPDANLWDVSIAPTIVMTQRGARREFQAHLLSRGVEVVQFDFLTPEAVAGYCAARGFLQCLWECGGTLAAPAIAGGSIHKCLAFVAPKMIGGVRAPSPVGELGNVEMTQATELVETRWEAIGRDMLMTGYLPSSGGPATLDAALDNRQNVGGESARVASGNGNGNGAILQQGVHMQTIRPKTQRKAVEFYKTWDRHGALSNFSPHPISMPEELRADGDAHTGSPATRLWPTLEHYYQAQKFSGVADPDARLLMEEIWAAQSPEEAARLGRGAQRTRSHLVRPDWETAKLFVMLAGLEAKFTQHDALRETLLATAPLDLVEASPQDFFWGRGLDGGGANHLGALLGRVRERLSGPGGPGSSPGATPVVVESVRPHGLASTAARV